VTVALSGDGGDELFGGYDRYRNAAAAWRDVSRHPLRGHAASWSVERLAGRSGGLARRLRKPLERMAHTDPKTLYRDRMSQWRPADRVAPRLGMAHTRFDDAVPETGGSLARAFMLIDTETYLPDDLLVKVDRASMAASLEVRAPLLDRDIAHFAWSLPPALGDALAPKALLREALYRRVPRTLIDRPKQGFEPPIGSWLREGLRDWAEALLTPDRLSAADVDPAVVLPRWHEHRSGRRNWTYPLWNVLMLMAWREQTASNRARSAA
jgi:asparagine synthase (glutamine-hydrolysing)